MSLARWLAAFAVAGGMAIGAPGAMAAGDARAGIDGVDVEQVEQLAVGVPLRFSVYGSPNAAVTLRIDGGWHALALQETARGVYEGVYVIDARDAIDASSRVTATLQRGDQRARADLDEPLLLAAVPLPWADAAIATTATPAAAATRGAVPATAMPPASPIAAAPVPSVAVAAAPAAAVDARAATRAVAAACADCARVEAIRAVVVAPPGGDALPDRIARAVLGDELGRAHTEHMRRLVGILTGRAPDPAPSPHTEYDVVLRTADGAAQVRRYAQPPPFAEGATVRLGGPAVQAPGAPY